MQNDSNDFYNAIFEVGSAVIRVRDLAREVLFHRKCVAIAKCVVLQKNFSASPVAEQNLTKVCAVHYYFT